MRRPLSDWSKAKAEPLESALGRFRTLATNFAQQLSRLTSHCHGFISPAAMPEHGVSLAFGCAWARASVHPANPFPPHSRRSARPPRPRFCLAASAIPQWLGLPLHGVVLQNPHPPLD